MNVWRNWWQRRAPWVQVLLSVAGVLLAYYTMPVEWTGSTLIVPVLLAFLGLGVVTWALVAQVRRHFSGSHEIRLPMLVTLMSLVLAVFAFCYFTLETTRPGQFVDLSTRTDALYFTVTVLTTVGFGDIHAEGQTARAMVTFQMAFDLVFVAAAGSLLAGAVRSRIAETQATTAAPSKEEDQ